MIDQSVHTYILSRTDILESLHKILESADSQSNEAIEFLSACFFNGFSSLRPCCCSGSSSVPSIYERYLQFSLQQFLICVIIPGFNCEFKDTRSCIIGVLHLVLVPASLLIGVKRCVF